MILPQSRYVKNVIREVDRKAKEYQERRANGQEYEQLQLKGQEHKKFKNN